MAKTKILDAILAAPRGRCEHVDAARELLVMPEKNHAFSDGDPFRAAVDRYVVPKEAYFAVKSTVDEVFYQHTDENDKIDVSKVVFSAPLNRFWLEMNRAGYLFDAHAGTLKLFCRTPSGRAAVVTISQIVVDTAGFRLGLILGTDVIPEDLRELAASTTARLIAFCALVTTPRAVSVRRQSPGRMTRAERMAIQRAAQRGRPMHSFNVVTFRPGGPSIQRGCVERSESMSGGVRRHWMSGHWRLIDPKNGRAAYVVWIEAKERGNEKIGRVVKTRVVKAPAGEVRRGYVLPARAGKRGERIEVQAAH